MTFILYKDRKKEWRWKLVSRNNRKIANAGEGYKNKKHCIHMIHKIILDSATAKIKE